MTSTTASTTASTTFGTVLKEWRSVRRMSQLELGALAEVSTRHISFLESGRSNPSRPMVLHLSEALSIPRPDRNRLLGAAGFAPMYETHDPTSAAMEPIRQAITWTLEHHDPFPALVLDRHWNVLEVNKAAAMMFEMMQLGTDINLIDAFVDNNSVRSMIVNWSEVGFFLLTRLRTESASLGGDPVLDAAIAKLVEDTTLAPPDISPLPPALPAIFNIDGLQVSLLSTIAQFGTAEDIALADQRIELFFPGDDATRQLLLAAAGS